MNHIEIPKVDYDLMVEEIERLRRENKQFKEELEICQQKASFYENSCGFLDILR